MRIFLAALLLFAVLPRAEASTLAALVDQLNTSGSEGSIPAEMSEVFGLKTDAPLRYFYVEAGLAQDGSAHAARVILDEGKPSCLLFGKQWEDSEIGKSRTEYYRASLDGKLQRVVRVLGKVDKTGEPVEGSADNKILDPTSPKVQSLYQRELDFWLKGMYRKKPKKSKSASMPAAEPPVARAGGVAPAR